MLVSEVMLQQTQVARVVTYWPRFLEEYPTPAALAAATPARVRESWEGLGYYRRAANLRELARRVHTERGGHLPRDPEGLRDLPGIGRYTAGAVMTFAYERREPAVDTNVARVLRRAFHPKLPGGARGERRLWETARALLPSRGRTAWEFNQGIMELGALICTAREARCGICPVRSDCVTGRRRPATEGGPRRAAR